MKSKINLPLLFSRIRNEIERGIDGDEAKYNMSTALYDLEKSVHTDSFPRKYSVVLKLVSKNEEVFYKTSSYLCLLASLNIEP